MKLRKMLKRSILFLCAVFMIHQTSLTSVLAEKGGNDSHYTYTITLYSGKEGTFSDGSTEIKITDVEYGSVISLGDYLSDVSLNDSEKYYVRGIRESGKDNNTVSNPAFKVECDREYVVAYGIKGDMTTYVVNYVDSDGNTLAPSQTYYGVVGDQAVVAFHYVDGYRPQAYNLAKTLSKNEAENVLTFTYTRIPTPTTTVVEETVTNNTTTSSNTTNGGTTTGTDNTTTDSTSVDNDSSSTTTDDSNSEDSNTTDEDTTEDIIDLDEDETPLNNADSDTNKAKERPATFMYVMMGIVIVAIIGLIVLFVLLKKKGKAESDQ
jgi:hypothetical protein